MGAIMELEEKLNEVRSSHGHRIDDISINQGQIRKSIEEQIQIIHRIQLSDFENATLKITDIQSKLQEQIKTQAEDFRELTVEANKSMARQSKEMQVIKRQVEDRIESLNGTVDKKERGLSIKLQETRDKFVKIEDRFSEVTTKFATVSGIVETAIDQIHSTRARAEEATDIQKNRFEYFDMFMQSLKQSQATIDSRIGFLYTIVNELRWRERAETARTNRVTRQHSSSNLVGDDVKSTKSGKFVTYSHASVDFVEVDNLTQAVNDIEMEMKAKIEVLTDNLEQHRKETLHAISRARDKSLSSTTAVDKLQTVVERMNEKFSDITRLENELGAVQKKSDHMEEKVDHLEGVSENASTKVDVLARKLWDVFDSDMNLNQFIDYHLKDDKERLWRLEYDTNHLKHMTIGENVEEDTLPLHLQNTTVIGEVDHVKKNISRCLVKSEQLVDDVTNIAKQNDMIRNDMRDLKLLCDYLSSKNDETQRYCSALRKHLEYTNRKLDAYETGGKIPFRIFRSESQIYDFEEDLPPLEKKKKTPLESPKPSTPIFNLFMKNKERREQESPTVREVEALNLKSRQRVPTPEIKSAVPAKPKTKPSKKNKAPKPPPSPPKKEEKSPTRPPRTPKSSGSGFFNFFSGSKKPDEEEDAVKKEVKHDEPEIEGGPKSKGILERIFGSSDEPKPSPTPPPKHIGHLKKKRLAPEPPTKGHDRKQSGRYENVTPSEEDRKPMERLDISKISVERGAIAEEKSRKEIESENKLRALRDQEIADREFIEKETEARRKEEDKRKRRASIDAKSERERRLVDATDRAREARANDKVIKGELPTMERYYY
ncbi:interaptin-like [Bolinopsis microptera]|uniref:interaptin-like n=1 Tax=Bolinopsis microptera TaxID=2820187 RepID=UPI00307967B3